VFPVELADMYDPPGLVEGPWGKRNGGLGVGVSSSAASASLKQSHMVLTGGPPQHPVQPPLAHQTSSYSSLTYGGAGASGGNGLNIRNRNNNIGNSIPAHSKIHHYSTLSNHLPHFDGVKKENHNQLSPVKKRVKESSPQGQNGKKNQGIYLDGTLKT
jgi:hypothetical protein